MNDHLKGLIVTTLGVLLVVPNSLLVRLIEAEPMVATFWLRLTAGCLVLTVLLAVQGAHRFRAVLASGWPSVIYTVLFWTTAPAFVLAVTQTSVANAVFIFASMPVFAAAFIGAASCLLALGPRYISTAEVYPVGPARIRPRSILVWAAIGEDPGP